MWLPSEEKDSSLLSILGGIQGENRYHEPCRLGQDLLVSLYSVVFKSPYICG